MVFATNASTTNERHATIKEKGDKKRKRRQSRLAYTGAACDDLPRAMTRARTAAIRSSAVRGNVRSCNNGGADNALL